MFRGSQRGPPAILSPEHVLTVPGPRRCPRRGAGSPAVLQAGEALWL